MTATVLIVDDHTLFAQVMRPLLDDAGLEVVGIAASADEGARLAKETAPDVALIDLFLGEVDGFGAAELIHQVSPRTRSIIMTVMGDAESVGEALRRGLQGFLGKDLPVSRFITAIRAVVDGQVVLPPAIAPAVAGKRTRSRKDDVRLLVDQLTPREWQVLGLLVEGVDGRGIADRLDISPNTVRTHVQGILMKLQVHSRLEAATFAVRHGLFETARPGGLPRSA
jgi:two-component system nitrate/nitrite response regulator NarL